VEWVVALALAANLILALEIGPAMDVEISTLRAETSAINVKSLKKT
jgi:hypothetical protein